MRINCKKIGLQKNKYFIFFKKKFSIFLVFLLLGAWVTVAFATTWDGQPFAPGATDNPPCLPSQINCDVEYSVTETDPVFSASSAFTITGTNISNWQTAYTQTRQWDGGSTGLNVVTARTSLGLGTAALSNASDFVTGTPWTSEGYLTSYTETDPTISAWAKAASKPSYVWTEIGSRPTKLSQFENDLGIGNTETDPIYSAWNKSDGISITKSQVSDFPTTLSSFTNDLGNYGNFLTSYTETDPTISAWAKAATKPTYTKSEVGLGNVDNTSDLNKPISTATQAALDLKQPVGSYLTSYTETDPIYSAWNKSTGINITKSQVSDFPTTLSSFTNDLGNYGGFLTSYTETDPTISSWAKQAVKPSYTWTEIGSRPTSLSQFTNDLGNYGGFLTSYTESDPIFSAWDKSTGISITKSQVSDFPTNLSAFTNGPGYITDGNTGWDNTYGFITGYTETDPIYSAWNKSDGISITKSQVSDFPTTLSSFTNDLGNYGNFLTSYTETDPTISAWAKAATKPSYTASEVGLGNVTNNPQWYSGNHPTTISGYGITDAQSTLGGTGIVKSTAGTISYLTDNSSNWNTAYSWGNHAGLYLGLHATADNSTSWNGYNNNIAGGPFSGAPSSIAGFDGTLLQRYNASALQLFLGLGSNAYSSYNLQNLGTGDSPTFSLINTSNTNLLNNANGRSIESYSDGVLFAKLGGEHNIIFGDGNSRYYSLYTPSGAATGSIRNYNGSDIITWTTGGNVGIGTTNPASLLDVHGSSGDLARFVLPGQSSNIVSILIGKNGFSGEGLRLSYDGSSGNSIISSVYSGGSMILKTSDAERMRITADGNVGIGTTTPGQLLEIYKNQNANTISLINNPSTGSLSQSSLQTTSGSNSAYFGVRNENYNSGSGVDSFAFSWVSSNIPYIIATNNSEKMRILGNGNVGIGTTSPASKLSVYGGRIELDNILSAQSAIQFSSGGTEKSVLYRPANSTDLRLFGSEFGDDVMTWKTGTGNVGIGTTSPAYKLDVAGNINATGYYYSNGLIPQTRSQTSSSSVPSAGWYRVAHLSADRGEQEITIFTVGGSWIPQSTTLRWGIGWEVPGIISISHTGAGFNYWTDARITNDNGSDYFLEVYFTKATDFNSTVKYFGGYDSGSAYAGALSAGGGSVNFTTKIGGFLTLNNRFVVDGSGNVGIGTISPQSKLQIGNITGSGTSTATPTVLTMDDTFGNGTLGSNFKFKIFQDNSTNAYGLGVSNNLLEISSGSNGGIGFFTDKTNQSMTILSGGNVGIGTNNPSTKLEVRGATDVGDGTSKIRLIASGGVNYIESGNNAWNSSPTLHFTGYSGNNGTFMFDGNVGVGATPSYTLDVGGIVRAERYRGINSLVLNSYSTVNPSSNVYLYSPVGDRDAWIYLDSADTTSNWGIYHRQIDSAVSGLPANAIGFVGGGNSDLKSYISLADGSAYFKGNVGIGTTSPAAKLHIHEDSSSDTELRIEGQAGYDPRIFLKSEEGNGEGFKMWYDNSVGDTYFDNIYSQATQTIPAIRFRTNVDGTTNSLVDAMTILHNGNVGIRTTDPTLPLQIHGAQGGPLTSGSTQNGLLRLSQTSNAIVLDVGVNAVWDGAWFQAVNKNNLSSNYPIILNPNGGNVGVGTTSPITKISFGNYAGYRLPYIDGTAHTFDSNGITISENNTDANTAIGGGIDFTNNTYSVGSYSPILSFSSVSPSGVYNNAYAGIYGVLEGQGGDANWNIGSLAFTTATSYGLSEKMRILANGNVGIGTTSPTYKLDINAAGSGSQGVSRINTTGDGTFIWGLDTFAPSLTAGHNIINMIGVSGTSKNSGYIGFNYTSSGSNSNFLTFGLHSVDNILNINGAGNVGIGTTNPEQALHVRGSIVQNGFTNPETGIFFREGFSSSNKYNLSLITRNLSGSPDALSMNAYGGITFVTGSNDTSGERVRITSGGNVGIGTTNPTSRFQVNSINDGYMTYDDASGIAIFNSETSTGEVRIGAAWQRKGIYSDSDLNILGSNGLALSGRGNNTDMYINTSGNVGIGTTSPGSELDVRGQLRAHGGFVSYIGDGVFNANAYPAARFTSVYDHPFIIGYADGGSGNYQPSIGFSNPSTASYVGSLPSYQSRKEDESYNRFQISADGAFAWGQGSSDLDTSLSRESAGILRMRGTNPKIYLTSTTDAAYQSGLQANWDYSHQMSLTGYGGGEILGQYSGNTILAMNGSNVGIGGTPYQKLWVQDGEIWMTGNNNRLAFNTDGSTDSVPNASIYATENGLLGRSADIVFKTWDGSSDVEVFRMKSNGEISSFASITSGANLNAPGGTVTAYGDISSSAGALHAWTGIYTQYGDIETANGELVASGMRYSSDETLKENIEDVNLDKFKNVKFHQFNFISDPDKTQRYGVIAQEVLGYAPELVGKNSAGKYTVNYIDLFAGKFALTDKTLEEMDLRVKTLESLDLSGATSISNLISSFFADEANRINKIFAKTVVTEGIEMKDSATGETYCVTIKNGEFDKVKGKCDEIPTQAASPVVTPEETSSGDSIPTDQTNIEEAQAPEEQPVVLEEQPSPEVVQEQPIEPTPLPEAPVENTPLPEQPAE